MSDSFIDRQGELSAQLLENVTRTSVVLSDVKDWARTIDDSDAANAITKFGEVLIAAKTLEKTIDATYKDETAPINSLLRDVRAAWKECRDAIEQLIADINRELDAFRVRDRQWRIAEEARQRQLAVTHAQELRGASGAEATAIQGQILQALQDIPEPQHVTVTSVDGTLTEATVLDFQVTDIGALASAHPECVEVRRAPLLALLRAAESDTAIPGVTRFYRQDLRTRTRTGAR